MSIVTDNSKRHNTAVVNLFNMLKLMGRDVQKTRARSAADIILDGVKCKVCAHRMPKYDRLVMEYCTDNKSDIFLDFDDYIFVDLCGDTRAYRIGKMSLYEDINKNMDNDHENYIITKLSDDITSNTGLCISIKLSKLQQAGIIKEVMNLCNLKEDKIRAAMVSQYEPLINKMTNQFYRKVQMDWNSLKSMAYEGFVLAMNKYDSSRSDMSFMSFAAFEIRNNIMTRLTEESRTVKMPFEEQKRRTQAGLTNFTSVSIDRPSRDDEQDCKPRETVMGMVTEEKFSDGNVFEYLYQRLEDQFPMRECEMFYMAFGLKGYDEISNQMIAKHFGVSEGLPSQKKARILAFIRKDNELCEMLSNLMK